MKVVLEKFFDSINNRRIVLIAIIVFLLAQLTLSIQLLSNTLNYNKIYKGIYINNVYVSGMTVPEAAKLIKEVYEPRLETSKIILKTGDVSQQINSKKLIKTLNVDETVQKAFDEGRNGNVFSRLYGIADTSLKGKNIPLDYSYDEARVQQLVGRYSAKINKELVKTTYQIQEDKIIINIGTQGKYIDEALLRAQLIDELKDIESDQIEIPVVIQKPDPLDMDYLYKKVYCEPKDASFEVKDYKLTIVPAQIGRDFDLKYAKSLLEEKKDIDGSIIEIPLKITYPKTYENQLKAELLKDQISSFSTKYNQREENRSSNIKIAAAKINGVVLAPGQVFSYNAVVGKRTENEGFKEAHVYVGGKIVDGIGGGICQVSTTLYNAVLFADLEIVERRNHNMLVSYVPPGRDATVSYGSIDFKFKNNYSTPIRLSASSGKGVLSFSIYGISQNPNKKISLETEILKTYLPKQKIIQDPKRQVGYSKVVQKGMKGYLANTYKIVKENGKVISRTKISTSKYNPLERTVVKGTKPAPVITLQQEPVEPKEPIIQIPENDQDIIDSGV